MIDSKYRGVYQTLVIDPLLKVLPIQKATPQALTITGLLLGVLIPLFLFLEMPITAFSFLVLSGFCDTLDGSLARYTNQMSDTGAVLDITSDRLVEFAIILGLFLVSPIERGLPCLLMLGSCLFCITTFLVVGIFSKNESQKSFHYSPGIIERTEAFALFGAMILFPSAFTPLALAFMFLVFLTGLIRVKEFRRH